MTGTEQLQRVKVLDALEEGRGAFMTAKAVCALADIPLGPARKILSRLLLEGILQTVQVFDSKVGVRSGREPNTAYRFLSGRRDAE